MRHFSTRTNPAQKKWRTHHLKVATLIKITTNMDQPKARALLDNLNLGIDLHLLKQIEYTLKQQHQQLRLPLPLDQLSILSVACLVAQTKRLPSVENSINVQAGLPIQRFLSCLPHQKRLPLIARIEKVSLRWPACPASLWQRLRCIKEGYQLCKECGDVVRKLGGELGAEGIWRDSHFKLVWLAYVEIKQSRQIYNSGWTQRKLIGALLQSFYGRYPFKLNNNSLKAIVANILREQSVLNCQDLRKCSELLEKILIEVYCWRDQAKKRCKLSTQLMEECFNIRFIDKFFKWIAHKYSDTLGFERVDQTLFLDLNKQVTPCPVARPLDKEQITQGISKKIFFDSDSDDDSNRNCSQDLSKSCSSESSGEDDKGMNNCSSKGKKNEKEQLEAMQVQEEVVGSDQTVGMVPSSSRMQVLRWVQSIKNPFRVKGKRFSDVYFTLVGEQFDDYWERLVNLVEKQVLRCSPSCLDVAGRCKKTMTFFLTMMNRLVNHYSQEQLKIMLTRPSQVNCFAWISSVLINYAYKYVEPSLFQSIKAFGLKVQEAFIPLNWIGTTVFIPPAIYNYILGVEEHLLLVDLWRQGKGYEWLQRIKKGRITYLDCSIKKRLDMFIQFRTICLCGDRRDALEKVNNIKRRASMLIDTTELMRNNDVNGVLVLACLETLRKGDSSVDQKEVLARWNSIPKNFHEEINIKDTKGRSISIATILSDFNYGFFSNQIIGQSNDTRKRQLLLSVKKMRTCYLKESGLMRRYLRRQRLLKLGEQ